MEPWPLNVEQAARARIAAARRLSAITPLPLELKSRPDHDAWPLVGVGLMARAYGALEAVAALFPVRREHEASVLVRVLLEQITTFAWLAAEPDERMPAWLKHDRRERQKIDNSYRDAGLEFLAPAVRQEVDAIVAAPGPCMPDMASRARAVDLVWGTRLDELSSDIRAAHSLSGIYRTVYRSSSRRVHPSAVGLDRMIVDIPGRPGWLCVQRDEPAPRLRNAFTIAPLLYGIGMFVAAECLPGWPTRPVVLGAFEAPEVPRAPSSAQ
jgi:hypothetical protein